MNMKREAREAPEAREATLPQAYLQDMSDAQTVLQLDPETLDSTMRYRWVLNSPQRIGRWKARGYRLVSRSDDEVRSLSESIGENADDNIRFADVVLMCCPLEKARARGKAIREFGKARLRQPGQQFRQKAKRAGVTVTTKEGPNEL